MLCAKTADASKNECKIMQLDMTNIETHNTKPNWHMKG